MNSPHDAQVPREIDPVTGLPIGPAVGRPEPAPFPEPRILDGRYCRLEPIAPGHRDDLFAASTGPDAARRFLYLFDSPPASIADIERWITAAMASTHAVVFAVIDKASERCEGRQQLMNIVPAHRSIEIGNIYWGPRVARTRVASEAQFLLARHVFDDLGYRRYEWKCDALNAASRRAAERFGFTFEGHFRRAVINKGRTRDTTWYSIIEEEWPALRRAYLDWLDPDNFDSQGRQRVQLGKLTAAALASIRR
ncbi:MAG TPA: GNAT family protein [Hyphomicrobiaceae bacterium]|nr:GNAT family protein [Hyphomicrobiaceae bacterium]